MHTCINSKFENNRAILSCIQTFLKLSCGVHTFSKHVRHAIWTFLLWYFESILHNGFNVVCLGGMIHQMDVQFPCCNCPFKINWRLHHIWSKWIVWFFSFRYYVTPNPESLGKLFQPVPFTQKIVLTKYVKIDTYPNQSMTIFKLLQGAWCKVDRMQPTISCALFLDSSSSNAFTLSWSSFSLDCDPPMA